MSIKVEIADLAAEMERFGYAYLLTVSPDGRPHVVAVTPTWSADGAALVAEVGRRTADNANERSKVSLVWPPAEAGEYSLIVDADATTADGVVRCAPTTAVLHRPAPVGFAAPAGSCGSDCRPVSAPDPA